MLIVLYIDDASIAAPEVRYIDEFITSLETKGFTLTKEGTFNEFLGIKFTENKDAGINTLTQKGLIKKIIAKAKLGGLQAQLDSSINLCTWYGSQW
jgi:hypothetical protein